MFHTKPSVISCKEKLDDNKEDDGGYVNNARSKELIKISSQQFNG